MAVELRLSEQRAGQLEDLVGFAQCLTLAFKPLWRCKSVVATPALAPVSISSRLIHALSVWGMQPILGAIDSINGRPQRELLASVLLHHANSAFADLGRKFV
jgi:hypothetical protein